MTKKIRKVVIPVAGRGTRFLPATWLISTPSSLANFLAFGLADEISEILFLVKVFIVSFADGN